MEIEPSFPILETVDILSQRMRTFDIKAESRASPKHRKRTKNNFDLRRCEPEVDDDSSETDDVGLDLSDLVRLIECPVCLEVPCPPIYNCCNGHFVCHSCRPRLFSQTCVYCLADFTPMRNYPLEALVTSPLLPCDFIKYGCTRGKLTLQEYEEHVQNCFARYWCPGKVILGKQTHNHKRRNSDGLGDEDTSSEDSSNDISSSDSEDVSNCPRCFSPNPTRKVKCRKCQGIIRPPTPMVPVEFQAEF